MVINFKNLACKSPIQGDFDPLRPHNNTALTLLKS